MKRNKNKEKKKNNNNNQFKIFLFFIYFFFLFCCYNSLKWKVNFRVRFVTTPKLIRRKAHANSFIEWKNFVPHETNSNNRIQFKFCNFYLFFFFMFCFATILWFLFSLLAFPSNLVKRTSNKNWCWCFLLYKWHQT